MRREREKEKNKRDGERTREKFRVVVQIDIFTTKGEMKNGGSEFGGHLK